MTCKQWDIAVVPFPFVDAPQSKPRPVLIVSKDKFHDENGHYIAAMITTASQTQWFGDTVIRDFEGAGLKTKSSVRMKFFTLDLRFQPRIIGSLSEKDRKKFQKNAKSAAF